MSQGHDKLWQLFGLSYARFVVLPRVLMHAMPDDWQERMVQLLQEYHDHYDVEGVPDLYVSARAKNNRWIRLPNWLVNYRHPDQAAICKITRSKH